MNFAVYEKLQLYSKILTLVTIAFYGAFAVVLKLYLLILILLITIIYQIHKFILWKKKTIVFRIEDNKIIYGYKSKTIIDVTTIKDVDIVKDPISGRRLVIQFETDTLQNLTLVDKYSVSIEGIYEAIINALGDDTKIDGSIKTGHEIEKTGPKNIVVIFIVLQVFMTTAMDESVEISLLSISQFNIFLFSLMAIELLIHYIMFKRGDKKFISLKVTVISWILIFVVLLSKSIYSIFF